MKIVLLLMFIFSFETIAEQCSRSDNVTLRDPGMSFSQGQGETQDQLNSGTCYANTLSLMLEPLVGKPLSTTQIALFNAKAEKRNEVKEGKHWIEGAPICEHYEEIRKAQQKNPKLFRLCERSKGIDNFHEFREYEKAYFTRIEGFFKEMGQDQVSMETLKGVFAAIKSRSEKIRRTCDKSSNKFNPSVYRYGLIQKFKQRCSESDYRVKVNKKEKKKKEKEIRVTKELLESAGEIVYPEDRLELQNYAEKLRSLEKELKEIQAKIDGEKKVKAIICTPESMVGNNKTYELNNNIKEKLSMFVDQMVKNPEKAEDGKFIKSTVTKFIRKIFPRNIPAGTPHGFPEDLMQHDSTLSATPASMYRKKFGLNTNCLAYTYIQLKSLLKEQGEICYGDSNNGKEFSDKLRQSIFVVTYLSQQSDRPMYDELMNRLLNTDVRDLRGFMQNLFGYCRPEDGFQLPSRLQCKERTYDEFFSEEENIADSKNCFRKHVKSGVMKSLFGESCDVKNPNDWLPKSCYDQKRFRKIVACKVKSDLDRRLNKMRKLVRKSLSTKIKGSKGIPVGIHICAGFMKGGADLFSYYKVHELHEVSASQQLRRHKGQCKKGPTGDAHHAVSIVGQRCVNGRIEYQIQNSWGKSCKPYMKRGKSLFDCDPKTGLLWVPEEKLMMNLIRTSTLSSNKEPIPRIKPGVRQ
jgi:hypothetical protein